MAAPVDKKNRRVALISAGVAAAMVGLSYASVPLYSMFCQVTGFGGTTQRAERAPDKPIDRYMTIRFDANMASSLGWDFKPDQLEMKVKVGEEYLAHYSARNNGTTTMTGSAVFNVTPPLAGSYFSKIQCFCFTEQTLKPGQRADFPVAFFVDPSIADDPDLKTLDTITLSYTFYPVDKPKTLSSVQAPEKPATN